MPRITTLILALALPVASAMPTLAAADDDGAAMDPIFGAAAEKSNEKAQRQTDRQQRRVESRVDRESDEAMDKAVDKALDGLFD